MKDQKMSFQTAMEAGLAFAAALDRGNWKETSACLSPNCQYFFRASISVGAETIVSSYQTIDEWVKMTFESVQYESSVEALSSNVARVSFRDLLKHKGHRLDFRCQQIITLGADQLISKIEHVDLDGMPEKAEAFNRACGVVKPQMA